MTEDPTSGTAPFADGVAALEVLVAQLESGTLTLEEALAAFETGVGLVRSLHAQLDAAEARVELLVRRADGELDTVPLEDGEL